MSARGVGGWRIEGSAVFRHETGAAALLYEVECDREWQTREGFVKGWVGWRSVDLRVTRSSDATWAVNGRVAPNLQECADLDFGFTPATNLLQLRRIALPIGEAADVPVAWLDAPSDSLGVVRQRYERRSACEYWYESPRFNYTALLQVNAAGFVERYPTLWESYR